MSNSTNRIVYKVGITADTSALKKEIQSVYSTLDGIASKPLSLGVNEELKDAVVAASSLKGILENAFNVNTGKLNLTKVNQGINQGSMSIQKYYDILSAIGPEGERAFAQVAQAISKAQTPVFEISDRMNALWITLKNTARWQITSASLYNFSSALSTAYGYAKDLNSSLNNIRIVSGQSADQMADFAIQANKAAKELSSVTTAYTDASLIYYQAGLVGDAVTERANATIKMANVTGDTVETVSDQLTAIWNNFYDGSKSLEYYADVITALGAATASSTSEISEGLEKFAAIAGTVGLSYEYATTSLATIIDKTRQAPEVVGTALKTIFARIQGLSLGETLEDGTNLNKYSDALAKVGIDIFDQNEQLKDMDDILDELGGKWDSLNKAQKMALSQTVAGVRQYTQLISLLDNWDAFQENLKTATNSEGELEYQAQIYAQSWEAASKRVQAAAEGIYDSIINDDAFIALNDGLAEVLSQVENVIDSVGGFSGIVLIAGSLITKVFKEQLGDSLRAAKTSIASLTGEQEKLNNAWREEIYSKAAALATDETSKAELEILKQRFQLEQYIEEARKSGNKVLQSTIELNTRLFDIQADQTRQLLKQKEALEASARAKMTYSAHTSAKDTQKVEDFLKGSADEDDEENWGRWVNAGAETTIEQFTRQLLSEVSTTKGFTSKDMKDYVSGWVDSRAGELEDEDRVVKSNEIYSAVRAQMEMMVKTKESAVGALSTVLEETIRIDKSLQENTSQSEESVKRTAKALEILAKAYRELMQSKGQDPELGDDFEVLSIKDQAEKLAEVINKKNFDEFIGTLDLNYLPVDSDLLQLREDSIKLGGAEIRKRLSEAGLGNVVEQSLDEMQHPSQNKKDWADNLVSVANGALTASMNVQVLSSTLTNMTSSGISGVEKLVSALSAISMVTPNILSDFKEMQKGTTGAKLSFGFNVASVALGVLVGGVQSYLQHLEEVRQKEHEVREAELETIATNEELADTYFSLLETYQETGNGKSDLEEATLSVAEAFNLENAALVNLIGSYEDFSETLEGLLKDQNDQKKTLLQGELLYSEEEFSKTVNKGLLNFNNTRQVGSIDQASLEVLRNMEGYEDYAQFFNRTASGGLEITFDPNNVAGSYEFLEKYAAALRDANLTTTKGYEDITKLLYETRTEYQGVISAQKELGDAVLESAELELEDDREKVRNIEDYGNHLEKTKKYLQDQGIQDSLVDDLVEQYVSKDSNLSELKLRKELEKELAEFSDDAAAIAQGLTAEQVGIALTVAPKSSSIEDFSQKFALKLATATTEGLAQGMKDFEPLMKDIFSEGIISDENLESLMNIDYIKEAIEKVYGDAETFSKLNYTSQLELLREAHSANSDIMVGANSDAIEQLATQRDAIAKQLNGIREYRDSLSDEGISDENFAKKLEDLDDETANGYGIDLKANLDATELEKDLERLDEELKERSEFHIDIELEWDDIDKFKAELDSITTVANTLQDSAYKVGNSYQYPIDKVYDLMESYPELFAKAEITSSGLIQLNENEISAFLDSEEKKRTAAIDTEIEILKLEYHQLEEKRKVAESNLQIFEEAANGTIEFSGLTVDAARDAFTSMQEYQKTFGIDLEEYIEQLETIIIQGTKDSVIGTARALKAGLGSIFNDIKDGFKYIAGNWKDIISGEGENPFGLNKIIDNVKSAVNNVSAETIHVIEDSQDFTLTPFDGNAKQKSLNALQQWAEQYAEKYKNTVLKPIDDAMNTINAKILALRASKYIQEEGSGGSSSNAAIEDLKEIYERYHEITREIEYHEYLLEEIEEQLGRAYGVDKLKLYQKQLQEIYRLVELNSLKEQAALTNIAIDAAALQDLGLEPTVLEDGSFDIDNYTRLLNQALDEYNAYVDAYNAKTKEQQEADEEEFNRQKELYDDRVEALERYEETVDTYREQVQEGLDKMREAADIELESLNYTLEIKLNLKNAKDEVREFTQEIIESFGDALTHGTESLANQNDGTLANKDLVQILDEQQSNLKALIDSADEFASDDAFMEALEDLRGEIISTGESLLEWLETLETAFPDALDAANERFSIFTSALEHNNTILETMKNLVKLQGQVSRADRFDFVDKATQEQYDALLGETQLEKARYERARIIAEDAALTLNKYDENDVEYDTAYNNWIAALETAQQAEENYLSKAQNTMEAAQTIYINAIDAIAYEFEHALTGFDNIDLSFLQTQYSNAIDEEERYLDQVNSAYEIEKYQRKLQQDIDDTTNKTYQERLKALQEEIELRKEDNGLSEYDLNIMEAKYNMLQKEMALEDARNNTSEVRLTRNAQGNWSYSFTANKDEIENAEQDLADAQNDYYNIVKDEVKDVTKEIIETWNEMNQAIKEIYQDETLTVAEKEEEIASLREYYNQKILDLESNKNIALGDLSDLGVDIVDRFGQSYSEILSDMTSSSTDFTDIFDECLTEMDKALQDYTDITIEVGELTGTIYEGLEDKIYDVGDATDYFIDEGLNATDMMWDQLDVLYEQINGYLSYADAIMEAVNALQQLAGQNVDIEENLSSSIGASSGSSSSSNTDYMAQALTYAAQGHLAQSMTALMDRQTKIESQGGTYDPQSDYSTMIAVAKLPNAQREELLKLLSGGYTTSAVLQWLRDNGVSFDTGGYTGEFSDTRAALLHEKELVLNQSDTQNILSAVSAVRVLSPMLLRSIEDMLDVSAASTLSSMGGALTGVGMIESGGAGLEQIVNISADFPNATDQNEIREAILGLANYASQLVNKR